MKNIRAINEMMVSYFFLMLQKVEDGLDRGGLPGKQCVLRAICEIKETPIHEWSLVGEMITNFIL